MQVRIIDASIHHDGSRLRVGDVVDMTPQEAEALLARGLVERVLIPAQPLGAGATSSPVSPADGAPLAAGGPEDSRVDLNRASVGELAVLPALGMERAELIVAHRRAHGPFRSVDDLEIIDGIGKRTINRIRGLVTCT